MIGLDIKNNQDENVKFTNVHIYGWAPSTKPSPWVSEELGMFRLNSLISLILQKFTITRICSQCILTPTFLSAHNLIHAEAYVPDII